MMKNIIFKLKMLKGEKGDIGYYNDSELRGYIAALTNRMDILDANFTQDESDNKIATQSETVTAAETAGGNMAIWHTFEIPEDAVIIEASYCPIIQGWGPDTVPWKTKDVEMYIIDSTHVQVQVSPYNASATAYLKISYAYSQASDLSELEDIRIGYDGTVYGSAGTAVRSQISALHNGSSDLNDLEDYLHKEALEPQLFDGTLESDKLWNCWTSTVSIEDGTGYKAGEFDIPDGASFISSNYNEWCNNSFSAFVDDSYNKIDLVKNQKTQDSGCVYAVPVGATKVCFSFNASGSFGTYYNEHGAVFIAGKSNITNKNASDYPETEILKYYGDDLYLQSGDTLAEKITDLENSNELTTAGFVTRKNIITALNQGKYYTAWNIGDVITENTNSGYACGYGDVGNAEKITLNLSNFSETYSFFADADHKRIGTFANQKVGSTKVYTVPTGAKYVYISCNDNSVWGTYGIVVLSGDDNIVNVSANDYPYNTDVYFADNLKLISGKTLDAVNMIGKTYYVEKDGSGDYTKLVDAINEAIKYDGSVVYVGAGTFDIISELGSTYMNAVSSNSSTWGLVLKNNIHVIGTAKTKITANYTGSSENVKEYFSVFNAGEKGFTIENLDIEADYIRYIVHDDRGYSGQSQFHNRYINCSFNLTNGKYGDTSIGGGLGVNATYEIVNCRFYGGSNEQRMAYYHGNNASGETAAKCILIVKDNYFSGQGTFKMTKYGDSELMSTAYLSNNSFGSAPEVTTGSYAPENNVQIVAWNNEIRSS